jgi:S-formylglutathione hydrolase FrmB
MLTPNFPSGSGSVRFLEFESEILRGNRYGDPVRRRHPVYLPPSYDDAAEKRYPLVFGLIGYTGTGMHFFGPGTFSEVMHDRIDRLITAGMPEIIFLAPDCYNALGGSQYLNGASGRYEDYIVDEILDHAKRELHCEVANGIGVVGKSSGGFGALHLGMRHPQLFTAVVSHSGDAGFDHCVWPAVRDAIAVLDRFDGNEHQKIEAFLEYFQNSPQPSYDDGHCLMILANAAAYSPDEASPAGFTLPFDPMTGRKRDEVWQRWLDADPVQRVGREASALRQLRLLFIDCGNRDQYGIHLGTRQLHEELEAAEVPHEYEEFEGTHSGLQFRYDISLPKLAAVLTKGLKK